ncbi:LIM and calponin homology domains-containing protein 1a isoform X30 [Danio rerio]|uniref:LIM and calponin homology domains-containing protein 1a isoform X30 n=1 Tax=Danio rerio TaxID=7955 RepID=A0AC58J976_DANRE
MASSGDDSASNAQLDQPAEATPESAFQEAQKWIEAVTGRSFGDKDFRSGLENGILLCELLSSIKPGLVKKINRLPTPIAGLDNLTMFLRGCEEVGLKGSQLFDPGDLQDTSIRANLTGSDCSRKLKNVLITIYWLGKAANSCATYNGPTLDLKEFEGLLSMMRKECVNDESDSPKRSIRDSGYIDSWESERSDSLSPPRHGRDDSFDSLDSFGSRSQNTPSPDTVIRCNSDDSEADRKLPDVRKDDMSARRVSYKEPRAALPFNQYLPNKSNQTNYLPAPLRKRRSDKEEDWRSVSNSTSPVGGERPLRQECVEVLKEGAVVSQKKVQKHFTWMVEKGAELDEAELKKMRKLEKAGIKVLPAAVRYNSPIVSPAEASKPKSPSPDIILRRDNDFMRAAVPHQWDSDEEEEDEEAEQKVPDVQKDDLASRRARMNQFKPSVAHHFLPSSCSWKDREKWEGIRMASQHAVLERMEKMEQEKLEKRSQTESASPEVPIITRKDNPFLSLEKDRAKEGDEEDEREEEGKTVIPNPHKDDLARRRTGGRPRIPKDPYQSLVQTSITQSDLETWQRLKMNTESSESDSAPAEVSIITRKENPFLTPEKQSEQETVEGARREEGERVTTPNVKADDLARRRSQSGSLPQKEPRQSLAQTTITQSDLEKWQKLKMSTDSSESDSAPAEVSVITRKENPFLTPEKQSEQENEESANREEGERVMTPNVKTDDLARRRSQSGSLLQKEPRQSLAQTTITQTDLEKWQKLKMSTDSSFTLSSVAPPPRDAEDMPRKWPQMMDRQEAGSGGQESLIKHETITKSLSPMPEQPSRRPLWQEDDDDLPPIFRATSVSDEAESVSLIDMRDEEDELAYLRPHSQSRHEHLHNQYNKVKEEEDQWQDDLARWKNRRRSASQDLIKKEEERKMMEKLMTTDGGHGHRKKSIKTYKEIVEEKEKREQELHEQYCKASSPEEKAAVLQRYALRFTISDAILEKLQLPKLPSAASPMHTSPLHQPEQKTTSTTLVEAEVPELSQTTQTQQTVHVEQKITHDEAPAQPKIPKPTPPPKCIKAPEVLSAPSRVPPAPSKPVPLITPKPYSQPKFSQGFRKSLKSDGLIRVNGDHNQQEIREKANRDPLQSPEVNFSSSSPKPEIQSQQNEDPIVLESTDHQQDLQTPKPDLEKEVIKKEEESLLSPQKEISKEDTLTTLSVSEPAGKQPVPDTVMKRNFVVTTTIVTELTQTHPVSLEDTSSTEQPDTVQNTCDLSSTAESCKADQSSYSISSTEGIDYSIECIETPMLNLAKRVDHWTWDPNEERRRQERWQQEQERLLQEKYQREQEKLKEEWEKAQREVEEEERRHHEEERRILEETVTPLTPRTSVLSSSCGTEAPSLTQPSAPHETIVLSLADWERKQEMLEKQAQTGQSNGLTHSPDPVIAAAQQNGQRAEAQESQITATPQLQFIQDGSWSCKSKGRQEDLKKTASLDRKQSPAPSQTTGMRRTGSCENVLGTHPSKSPTPSQDTPPPSPSRSVSGKKLCSSCAHPLGKGAAMIIETLGLYFHIQCFKCGVCKGLLGDTSAGTDVRIRNGLLNCHECYIKSRAAGQPTTL